MRIEPDPEGDYRRRRAQPRRRRSRWRWLLLGFLVATIMPILVFGVVNPPLSMCMIIAWLDARLHQRADFRLHYTWVTAAENSDELALAVIAAEDQRFAMHAGFDFKQIRAALGNGVEGRELRGASTLSQQVAKNLLLWPGRSWLRKGLEAWFTFWIERCWSKRRILEVYLNIAQFGDGIYGARAASQIFLHKNPAALTRREAALLAAVLPNPLELHIASPSARVVRRRGWIEQQMTRLGGRGYLKQIAW